MKRSLVVVIITLATTFLLASPGMAKRVTLIGEVNDNYQIVADNKIYEVGDTPIGDDLVRNYMAFRVKVTGELKKKMSKKSSPWNPLKLSGNSQ